MNKDIIRIYITGPHGSGKTVIARHLVSQLNGDCLGEAAEPFSALCADWASTKAGIEQWARGESHPVVVHELDRHPLEAENAELTRKLERAKKQVKKLKAQLAGANN